MKWFITDMDGTFLNDKKEVAPNAKDVIVKLQDKGSKFIIATGRPDIAVKHYYYNLGMNDVVISNNGSLIRNLSTGEIVYQKSFKIEEIEKIHSMFKELNDDEIEFHVYTLNYIYCDHLSFSMARMKKLEADMPEELKTPMYIHDDIIGEIKKNNEDCQKIMMIAKDHEKVVNFFNEVSKVLEVDGTFSATDFFDIMPKGCNKGTAIEKLSEYYNSPIEDCVVFGDNFNDKEMFDVAGWSVCPNNAKEEIQTILNNTNSEAVGLATYLTSSEVTALLSDFNISRFWDEGIEDKTEKAAGAFLTQIEQLGTTLVRASGTFEVVDTQQAENFNNLLADVKKTWRSKNVNAG